MESQGFQQWENSGECSWNLIDALPGTEDFSFGEVKLGANYFK